MAIKVEFIQGSINAYTNQRITTLVLEYPRIIHSQLMTHRVFTRNSSSTRAIPIKTSVQQIKDNPAKYLWTYNKAGMSGMDVTDPKELIDINNYWFFVMQANIKFAEHMDSHYKLHKQHAGRVLEPFQNIRVCLTSTEWANWEHLRLDADAQPEIQALAKLVKEVMDKNQDNYQYLEEGEYHVPFIKRVFNEVDSKYYYLHPETHEELDLQEAINLSVSICAQTSYRKEDCSPEKTSKVIDMLFKGNKLHASPLEHIATPVPKAMNHSDKPLFYWPKGITHMDRNGKYWSGNFKEFIQYRQLIPNHDGAKLTPHPHQD